MVICPDSRVQWCHKHGHMKNASCPSFVFLTSVVVPQWLYLNGCTLVVVPQLNGCCTGTCGSVKREELRTLSKRLKPSWERPQRPYRTQDMHSDD